MSNYEEVKQALANNNIKQGILIALGNSLQIKITSTLKDNENKSLKISTNLNLIKGVKTEIDSQILESQQGENLSNFHGKQVNSVDEIWDKNRRTLVKIYQLLVSDFPEKQIVAMEQNTQTTDNVVKSSLTREEFENFDLELITDEKTYQSETENTEEKLVSGNIDEAPDKKENWLDEIDNSSESKFNLDEYTPTTLTNDNLDADLESEILPLTITESTTTDTEEEMIAEEVEITPETVTENWDEIEDWEEENEEINTENNSANVEMDEESTPIYSIDEWEEWIDEDDITIQTDETEIQDDK